MSEIQRTLPWFSSCLFFDDTDVIIPFYIEKGIAKSGYFVSGDWMRRDLTPEDLAQISQQGFPLNNVSFTQINVVQRTEPVYLVFLEKEHKQDVVDFWASLIFLCTGTFFNKYKFLKGGKTLGMDGETIETLEEFFSGEKNSPLEENCNIIFDADRRVLIVRGLIGKDILGDNCIDVEIKPDYPALQKMITSFLK